VLETVNLATNSDGFVFDQAHAVDALPHRGDPVLSGRVGRQPERQRGVRAADPLAPGRVCALPLGGSCACGSSEASPHATSASP